MKKSPTERPRDGTGKSMTGRLLFIALLMLIGMTLFESLKQLILPGITVWESHIVTIIFSSAVAVAAVYSAIRKLQSLYEQISEESRARNESEERFRTIFDKAHDGMLLADAENKQFLMGNEAISKMLGYSQEELRQLRVHDIHPREELPAILEGFEKQVKGEFHLAVDRTILRRDGTLFYADIRTALIKIGARTYLLGTFRDITERKRVEEETAFKNLVLSTQQECASDGILVVNESAAIISYNRMFLEMWGIPPDLVEAGIDAPVLQFVATRPVDQEGFLARVRYLYEHREEKSQEEITLKDGRIFDRYSAPMTGANGKYYGRVWYFRDITLQKRDEAEVRRLNEELRQKLVQLQVAQEGLMRKEKLTMLGLIAGGMGNELRNPLGVMNNAVFFLQSVLPDADETVREYLDIIKKEIDNSLRIITDLLDFTRPKAPQVKALAARELTDVSLGRCAIPENIDLQTEIPVNLPLLRVDPLQMEKVLENLITNAVQAMPEGGALRISAHFVGASLAPAQSGYPQGVPLPDFLEISVADTGEGIAPVNMKRLFQPLFTTKSRGIGLGLSICKSFVEVNDGRIEVESQPGKGTVFTLRLPTAGDGA